MLKPNPLLSTRVGQWPDKDAASPEQRAASRARAAVDRQATLAKQSGKGTSKPQ